MNATTIAKAPIARGITCVPLLHRHVQARFRCTRMLVVEKGYAGVGIDCRFAVRRAKRVRGKGEGGRR
jgi:hypothetical protein